MYSTWKLGAALAVAVAGGALAAQDSTAQSYPTRPVRIVVPFPAGGSNDIVARVLAQQLSEALRQQCVVDNRGGAGGNIGTDYVAKAPADGYTLLSGGMGSLVLNPIVTKVPYDTLRDFAPIILIARAPNVLVVHPSLPARSVGELIALARKRSGQLNYGSGGVGSTPHLSGALFAAMAGVSMTHVAYKGSAPAITDLLAGQVQLAFGGIPAVLAHVNASKLRALGLTGLDRSEQLRGVPTISESGLKGYDLSPWYGLLAPAGTPADIVKLLSGESRRALGTAAMKEQLLRQGAEPDGAMPDAYAAVMRSDIARWSDFIRKHRIGME